MRVRLNVARLQARLAASALSQNHWALRMGVSRGHWSDLVNGRHPYPSPKTRLRMVEVLGVPNDELFLIEAGPTAWHDTDFRAALSSRYLIDSELGQGAMGAVYLARDVARGRTVAVKVLAPEAVCGVGADTLLREIAALSQLQHPNVLPLFDSGVVADHPFLVMPLIRGGSLRDQLRRDTRIALPTALTITRGIAEALQHAHGEFVLHCDVKPENILLHGAHAWLMDFGISRVLHAEVSEWRARSGIDVSAGTPAYVSPEQANGDADIDGRADVYSLGCVVYEMLTGRPPFEGTTTDAVVAQRFLASPPPLRECAPEVPGAVADAIGRAMELQRERRPSTPTEFAAELERAANEARRFHVAVSLAATRAAAVVNRYTGRASANRFGGTLAQGIQDARITVRTLRRDWRFALAYVLPLALGLGAGATFYSIVDHLLYRPPPGVRNPEGILRVAIATERFPDPFRAANLGASWLDLEALRRHSTTLSTVAAFIGSRRSLGVGADARTVPVMLVTASYFPLLGVRPQRGRFFTAEEDAATSAVVPCVLGNQMWRSGFGANDGALGQRLQVGGVRCDVVGVAPKDFNGLGISPVDIWLPVRAAGDPMHGDAGLWNSDRNSWIRLLARPRAGATLAEINLDVARVYRTVTPRTRDRQLKGSMAVASLAAAASAQPSGAVRTAVWLTGGAAALFVLVCANLLNLLIARNIGRLRETAIRLALGGGRLRLFVHQAMECVTLALLAGLAALVVVHWAGPLTRATLLPGTTWADGPLTGRVGGLAIGVSMVVGLTVAALTAWYASRVDPTQLLNAGGGGRASGSRAQHRARFALVGVQAALSMALLLASSAYVRSFRAASATDLGFEMRGLIYADVPSLHEVMPDAQAQIAFFSELHERVRRVPGVASASLAYNTPWYNNRTEVLREPGRDSLPLFPGLGWPAYDAVTPDYMTTMRATLRAGRWLSDGDGEGGSPVMVVSSSMAQLYWGGDRNALGRCLLVGDDPACREVVGVMDDIRFTGGLDEPLTPSYWIPRAQMSARPVPAKLFIRADGDPAPMVGTLRRIVQTAGPGLPAADVHVMRDHLERLLSSWRLGAMAFTALGALAAIIAMVGLFSVMAYLVAERRREFAIRTALGACRSQIMAPVLRQAVVVVGVGAVAGLIAAWRAAPWLQPQLFHVQLLAPCAVAAVLAALVLVAIVSVIGPARRAAARDPVEALRAD